MKYNSNTLTNEFWGLPQQLRKALLQKGGEFHQAARILDTLLWLKYQHLDIFTEKEFINELNPFHIDKKTIRKVLKLEYGSKYLIFEKVKEKDAILNGDSAIFTPNFQVKSIKKDRDKYRKSEGKNQSGRPSILYIMPNIETLWHHFCPQEVKAIYYQIRPDDLMSMTRYRQAIQREIIRTQPGKHRRQDIADQLGVTARSTSNYDKHIGTIITPNYQKVKVTRRTIQQYLDNIPWGELMDDEGNTYPPSYEQFTALLGAGRNVYYYYRTANDYALPSNRYERAKFIGKGKKLIQVSKDEE